MQKVFQLHEHQKLTYKSDFVKNFGQIGVVCLKQQVAFINVALHGPQSNIWDAGERQRKFGKSLYDSGEVSLYILQELHVGECQWRPYFTGVESRG